MPSVEYTGDPGRRAKGLDHAATKHRRGATKPLPRTTNASRRRSGSLFEERSDQPQQLGRFERLRDEPRSEEHTSELQSPCNLVCRLLLEKKKKTRISPTPALLQHPRLPSHQLGLLLTPRPVAHHTSHTVCNLYDF